MSSAAIPSGSSCCSWSPCGSVQGQATGDLKERVCPQWRMAPGLVALVATVIGVICALIWDSPYLCIPFGLGIFASIYMMYLGWDFRNLKTFAESNAQLENSVTALKTENEALLSKLHTFEEENKKLQEVSTHLQGAVDQLRNENSTLADSNTKLQLSVSTLEKVKVQLETEARSHLQHLEKIHLAMSAVEGSLKQVSQDNLAQLTEEIKKLKSTRVELDKAHATVQEGMKERVKNYEQATQMLEQIITKLTNWNDPTVIANRIRDQGLLNDSLLKLETQLARGDGRLEEQNKQLQELTKIKEGFSEILSGLLKVLKELQTKPRDHLNLEEEISKVEGVLNQTHALGNGLGKD